MMYYQEMSKESARIGMSNLGLGWLHLVDQYGRIRWQAHGVPEPKELESLARLTRELVTQNQNK